MILDKVDDPRDNLSRATRYELCQFAAAHGVSEIHYSSDMTLDDMKTVLRERGLTNIHVPPRMLGDNRPPPVHGIMDVTGGKTPVKVQYENKIEPSIPVNAMTRAQLAKECKARGIKMERTDSKEKLRERLGE